MVVPSLQVAMFPGCDDTFTLYPMATWMTHDLTCHMTILCASLCHVWPVCCQAQLCKKKKEIKS